MVGKTLCCRWVYSTSLYKLFHGHKHLILNIILEYRPQILAKKEKNNEKWTSDLTCILYALHARKIALDQPIVLSNIVHGCVVEPKFTDCFLSYFSLPVARIPRVSWSRQVDPPTTQTLVCVRDWKRRI